MYNKELTEYEFHEYFRKPNLVGHIIYWYDTNIIQAIGEVSKTTLEVRIRIICGMINKLPPNILSRELKIQFMECIWDTYKKMYKKWNEWHCKWILKLPF